MQAGNQVIARMIPYSPSSERMDETYLSVFLSVSNRAHGKRSRNNLFRGSVRFQLVFFFSLE